VDPMTACRASFAPSVCSLQVPFVLPKQKKRGASQDACRLPDQWIISFARRCYIAAARGGLTSWTSLRTSSRDVSW
jgi:hypothetical protein